jgi:hypothetical protein
MPDLVVARGGVWRALRDSSVQADAGGARLEESRMLRAHPCRFPSFFRNEEVAHERY